MNLALKSLFVIAAVLNVSPALGWQYSNSTDPFTDTVRHQAILSSDPEQFGFIVACSSSRGFSTSFIWVGDTHQRLPLSDIVVNWRLGDLPRGLAVWNGTPDGRTAWDGFSAHRLIDYLVDGEAASTDFVARAGRNNLSLDITGFGEMVHQLRNACDLPRSD